MLSIIIVSFNTEEILKRCLSSLGHNKEINIIVIDNASSDGSSEMIKKEFPKVKLIINQENVGFARAVNQGIRLTKGEAVFLLNSDTIIQDKALKLLLEAEDKLRPAIIGPKLINPDGTVQPSVFYLPTVLGAIEEYWFGRKNCFSKFCPPTEALQPVEAVSGGAMLISGETIQKIGLFNERYFFYFEDLDYCRRAKKMGIRVYFLPSAKVIHEHGASGHSLAKSEEQWRRLIPSSKIYHGLIKHHLIQAILWVGQKCRK